MTRSEITRANVRAVLRDHQGPLTLDQVAGYLGEVASCSLAEVSEEAGRRARRLFKAPAQRTLEAWA